jgi:hypothetical protein
VPRFAVFYRRGASFLGRKTLLDIAEWLQHWGAALPLTVLVATPHWAAGA